jgi:hypothetical protein
MKSAANDVLPTAVRRSLVDFGANISVARRRRGITTAMMAERLGVAWSRVIRVSRSGPT